MSAFEDILNEDDDVIETPEPDTSTATAGDDADVVVAESPAPVETETSAPAPVAEEAQPITREDGAQWSEKAQRWYKDGKIVAGERPEPVAAAPSEPSIPSVPPPTPEAPAVQPPAYEGEPWAVRGAGQKHVIPGAIVGKDGWVHLSPEHQVQHKALIAAGIQHNQHYGREKQEWTQQLKSAEARGEAKAAVYNSAAVALFDKVMDDNWLQSLIDNPDREREFLRRELALSLEKAKLAMPQVQAQPEPDERQVEQAFRAALDSSLDELLEDAPAGLLTAADIADMKAAYARRLNAYADHHPETGDLALDFHVLRDDFQRDVELYKRAQQQAAKAAADAQKAKAAAAFNAANTPKAPAPTPRKPTPTLVPAGTQPSGQRPGWDQSFKSAWSDDADE